MKASSAPPLMDFPLLASEERPSLLSAPSSSSAAPTGQYASQTPSQWGYIGAAGVVTELELLRGSVLVGVDHRRELLKQRIRQEIIASEMVQIGVLEEEVRRELRIERLLAMRKHRGGTVSSSSSSSFVGSPRWPEERVLLARSVPELELEKSSPSDVNLVVRKPAIRQLQNLEGRGIGSMPCPDVSRGTGSMPLPDAKPLKANLVGIKRRASELPCVGKVDKPVGQDWSCALCRVSTTSSELLNQHIQGKKHKARVEQMGFLKKAAGISLTDAPDKALLTNNRDLKLSELNTQGHFLSGVTSSLPPATKKQKSAGLWCDLCKVECNSLQMWAYHLGGKKHRTKLEKSQMATSTTDAEVSSTGGAPSSNVSTYVKVKTETSMEGAGTVEDLKVEGEEEQMSRMG